MIKSCVFGTVRSLVTYGRAQRPISVSALVSRGATQLNAMASKGPVASSIKSKLESSLKPSHLQIINESYMHNVPKGSETHFKVVVVSEAFSDLPLIKRHRLVNAALSEELATGVHALSIVAKTPTQWSESTQEVESSPACHGGFGK